MAELANKANNDKSQTDIVLQQNTVGALEVIQSGINLHVRVRKTEEEKESRTGGIFQVL